MLIFLSIFNQIYQPKEVEEVKVVPKTEEDTMKEYRTTTRRHENAKLLDDLGTKADIKVGKLNKIISKSIEEICKETVGKGREDGVILDFAGPNFVCVDNFAFGAVTRYIQISKDKVLDMPAYEA
ncbi:unnamed protein product [Lactuca virosa]|uniref:Uncharacterized protein n=1 Tax=Lactuca virosa TaxID=75947 RepID=A0AAU9P481_9ASTR|nr:unnamed protein product [Lactuca virosa]